MIVKVCGITSVEAALTACDAGVDILGFVFAKSKRKVTAEQAATIIERLPKDVKTAGVFVNESIETITHIAETAKLDYIQLHGDESPEFCSGITYPVIKAFSIKEKEDLQQLDQYDCEYFLLDSPGIKYRGGSGVPFDWGLLEHMNILGDKVILAGGLNATNVQEAIQKVQPAGVDVSSGVETNGIKDLDKIAAFINEAKKEERGKIGNLHIT